jgi:hypothetical protein
MHRESQNEFGIDVERLARDFVEAGSGALVLVCESTTEPPLIASCASAARSIRVIEAMANLAPSHGDLNDVLLRTCVETAIYGVLLAIGGKDESDRLANEQLYRIEKFASHNDLPIDLDADSTKPRDFRAVVLRAGKLLDQRNQTSNFEKFTQEIYDGIYRGTSVASIHGLGALPRHIENGELHVVPRLANRDGYGALLSSLVVPSILVAELCSLVSVDQTPFRKIEFEWKAILAKDYGPST